MTRFATLLTAAAVLAGSATVALAEREIAPAHVTTGTAANVEAGAILTSKELANRGLTATDTLAVTILPAGEGAPDRNDH